MPKVTPDCTSRVPDFADLAISSILFMRLFIVQTHKGELKAQNEICARQ
jgi:hypothetical protein